MGASFIQPIQSYNMTVIGQIRIDTDLYIRLRLNKKKLRLYGRDQKVNYRTAIVKAHFLDGQLVHFVWCEFEDDKGKKKPRLLLSNDTELSGLEVIVAYKKRWCIESIFNQLKNVWRIKQAWQKNNPITACRIRLGLLKYFSHVRIRDWWNVKSKIFQPPDMNILTRFEGLL